jgi:hypothetical protein
VPGDAEGLAEVFWGRYDQPEPEEPTEHDIAELAEDIEWKQLPQDEAARPSFLLEFARAVLAHCARPTIEPVPVSERLPGPEDCDAEGRCWAISSLGNSRWNLDTLEAGLCFYTHWLPHHALPVPGAEVASVYRGSESSLADFNDGGMPLG